MQISCRWSVRVVFLIISLASRNVEVLGRVGQRSQLSLLDPADASSSYLGDAAALVGELAVSQTQEAVDDSSSTALAHSLWAKAAKSCPKGEVTVVAEPPLEEGLFGMVLLRVLQLLPKALASPLELMEFQPQSPCYGDALASLFVDRLVVSAASCRAVPKSRVTFADAFQQGWANKMEDMPTFHKANALWTGRFELARSVQLALNEVIGQFPLGGSVLGVHYRGTDKSVEARPVSPEDMWTLVEDFINRTGDVASVFVATDQNAFVDLAKTRLPQLTGPGGRPVELVMNTASRANSSTPVHKLGTCPPSLAQEALLDSLVLSRCSMVLKTASQLSAWAKIFNPDLEISRVNAVYRQANWFPDAEIPLYKPNAASDSVKQLLAALQTSGSLSSGASQW